MQQRISSCARAVDLSWYFAEETLVDEIVEGASTELPLVVV
jgi:hypothetical protein